MKRYRKFPLPKEGMDKECVQLCLSMNVVPGIQTIESCCGHGKTPYRIWFVADDLESLPRLLYYFDPCHSGCPGWSVSVKTDCVMSPVTFKVEGPTGELAHANSLHIAHLIMNDSVVASELRRKGMRITKRTRK